MRSGILLLLAALSLALVPTAALSITEVFGNDILFWSVSPAIDSDLHQPAVAYDADADRYLLAWSQDQGDAGFRIFHGIVNAASGTAAFAPSAALDSGVGQARQVSCAWDPVTGLYLVVWSQDHDAPGAFEIFGRYLDASNVPAGPAFAISSAGASGIDASFDALDPDAAADGNGGFLVAWTQDDDQLGFGDGHFEIYTRALPAGSSTPLSATKLVTNVSVNGTALLDAIAPAIAHYPDVNQWGMVFEFDVDAGPAHLPLIDFRVLDADGSLPPPAKGLQSTESLVGFSAVSKAGLPVYFKKPDIAFDRRERQFLAVWETNQSGEPRIAGRMVLSDYSFGPGPLDYSLESPVGSTVCIARDATVAYSFPAGRFLVGWSGTPLVGGPCPGDREILVREVERDGVAVAAAPAVITDMAVDGVPAPTAVSPVLVASEASHRGLFAMWSGDSPIRGWFQGFGQFLTMDIATAVDDAPAVFRLSLDAVPNPFNPSTMLHYDLPRAGKVRLDIYDVRGARVRTLVKEEQGVGSHRVRWTGIDDRGNAVASGVYLLRLEHPDGVRTQKVALVE
jgi:FlgD Ig-like domain